MHASPPADLQQTDTYFIVAHFHYVLFGGSMMGIFAGIYHYFPKMTGRLASEKLGTWSFWLMFIGMNVTFFPMHFSGLLGMPRRIYQFDAGQGVDTFNLISSIGAYVLGVATLIFVFNFFKSRASGAIAPADPWGAPTVDWSIPSPPPDYNYAELPQVTSRYPLWDVSGTPGIPLPPEQQASSSYRSARELGIAMPNPSIMPFIVAFGIVVLMSGSLFLHLEGNTIGVTVMVIGGLTILFGMWNWLLTPLEDEH
jgi:cytochrome c oxidase subunit 1